MAFLFSSLAIAGIILTAGFSMFLFVMPSSLEPSQSLTMWDSTASQHPQGDVVVAVVFVPTVLAYTIWTYIKMFGRVSNKHIEDKPTIALLRRCPDMWYFTWILGCCWPVCLGLSMRSGWSTPRTWIVRLMKTSDRLARLAAPLERQPWQGLMLLAAAPVGCRHLAGAQPGRGQHQ